MDGSGLMMHSVGFVLNVLSALWIVAGIWHPAPKARMAPERGGVWEALGPFLV